MRNKFVDFVSDENFLEYINHVVSGYPKSNEFKISRDID